MGARMLRQWLRKPLFDKKQIVDRLDLVETLVKNNDLKLIFKMSSKV